MSVVPTPFGMYIFHRGGRGSYFFFEKPVGVRGLGLPTDYSLPWTGAYHLLTPKNSTRTHLQQNEKYRGRFAYVPLTDRGSHTIVLYGMHWQRV